MNIPVSGLLGLFMNSSHLSSNTVFRNNTEKANSPKSISEYNLYYDELQQTVLEPPHMHS